MRKIKPGQRYIKHWDERRKVARYELQGVPKFAYKQERPETVREFVHRHRNSTNNECIFVPGSVKGRPAKVHHCGKGIAASKYMCLLTHGTPRSEGMHSRHLCGNGHLSCVNPNHIVWGSPGDNQADANKHRGLDDAQDKIHAID